MAKKKSKKEQKRTSGIIIGIAIVVIIIGLVTLIYNSNKETCRDVQVPYEAQEEYTVQEPYTDEECSEKDFSYSVDTTWDTTSYPWDDKIRYNINFKITNNEDEAGYFKYQRHFRTIHYDYGCETSVNNVPYKENSDEWSMIRIYAKSTQIIQCNLLLDEGVEYTSYLPQVIPPVKRLCETITKYRTVTKTRTVTKYRTERVCE